MTPKRRYIIEIGEPASVTILLVGCGGTGSFAALHLARLAHVARQKFRLSLIFIDPDTVELKNIGRQNFCPAEIGRPKARALAGRYSLAFGLEIEPIESAFSPWMLGKYRNDLTLVVGAVDNAAARRDIDAAVRKEIGYRHRVWWLDAGNSEHAGQVLLGNGIEARPTLCWPARDRCTAVPLPSVQEPDLLKVPVASPNGHDPGCADLLVQEAQSLMINQAMAGWLSVYIYRLLLAHDLDLMATYVDQAGGSVRSVPITGGAMEQPERAQYPAGYPVDEGIEWDLEEDGPACPRCGAGLAEGMDEIRGEMVEIVFCPQCDWRAERVET